MENLTSYLSLNVDHRQLNEDIVRIGVLLGLVI